MNTPPTGLDRPHPNQLVVRDMLARSRRRMDLLSDAQLVDLAEDALYQERKRLERSEAEPDEQQRLDTLARAIVHGDRTEIREASLALVALWADEVHGKFSPRVYNVATRLLPRALTGLLSAKPERLRDWDLSLDRRLQVDGDLDLLRDLAREATLILAPTHVSNLDSPMIGHALFHAGMPPFVYGAGLNLFSNPLVGFWLRRLGAYTVDRRKQAALYKQVLKDYSVRCLVTKHHSLFFPGGTRARSGAIETHIKKGLLGTGIVAWQEMLAARRPDPEVYVVPLTLTFQLVLEASTLIDDHLAESGKARYIITDDEFSQPTEVATFGRRVLDLDASVVTRFGQPLDLLGNPVARDPFERKEQAGRRRRYVTNRDGEVEWDEQRDRVYTERLARSLVEAYPRGATIMSTHLAAWVAWTHLEQLRDTTDEFRLVRVEPMARRIPRAQLLERLERARTQVVEGARAGRWHHDLPQDARGVLATALDRFGRYHKTHALAADGDDIVIEDPRLCLYYRNRATFADLEV